MFIIKVAGRTSMELSDTFRSYEHQLQRSLGLLDGADNSTLLLFHVPDRAGWPDSPGFAVAEYEQAYLQSAGTAEAMIVELRCVAEDGELHRYAVGRTAPEAGQIKISINGDSGAMAVDAREVFTADEASGVYLHYLKHLAVPDSVELRPLD